MIKDKPEKKTKVCNDCITLMSEADYAEHEGKCQLCRDSGDTDGLYLFCIHYSLGGDNEIQHRVYPNRDIDYAETRFTEEIVEDGNGDYGVDWCSAERVSNVGSYTIHIVQNGT